MPHRVKPDNRRKPRLGRKTVGIRHKADSVKALLGNPSHSVFGRLNEQALSHQRVRKWLENKLPQDLVGRLSGVVERAETLVIFAESAGWSARVRYAVAEIEPALLREYPNISVISVRVMPRD
jgi:hypothetical protein